MVKKILKWGGLLGVGMNAIAALVAYGMTHSRQTEWFSLGIPRPLNTRVPTAVGLQYQTQRIPVTAQTWIETWYIPASSRTVNGTVLLFPGSGSSKDTQLLPVAQSFHRLGYETLLVDYQGVGGSSGHSRTIGMKEAKDVATTFRYAQKQQMQRPIVLYGISMGSAAVLRAIAQESITPDAIVLESPFVRFLDTVKSRFRVYHIPALGLPELLVFWGGLWHGVNGFDHNPITFAQQVRCPALVLQGAKDKWTSVQEVELLAQRLPKSKQLVVFPTAGHQLLVAAEPGRWMQAVAPFLSEL